MSKKLISILLVLVMMLSVMTVGIVSVGAIPKADLDDEGDVKPYATELFIRFVDSVTGTQLSPNSVINDNFTIKSMKNGTVDNSFSITMSDNTVHVSNDILYFDNEFLVKGGATIELDGYVSSGRYYDVNYYDDLYESSAHYGDAVASTTRICILTVTVSRESEITKSGNDGTSIVTLDYNTANLKVTVPTVLPVNVDSNNNVTVADNAQISNLSNGSVDVTNAEIQTDEWSVVGFDTDFTKVPVDTKQYGFKLNGDDVSDGVNTSVFNIINGNDHIGLLYDANVAIQSRSITNEDIGRIVFTVAWHK